MSTPIDVTSATFKEAVIESDKPVVVDFWAQWCGPCKKLSPIIEDLAEEYGDRITFAKVDLDKERDLGAMFQILSIPTVLIFNEGKKVDEFNGLRPRQEIAHRLTAVLN